MKKRKSLLLMFLEPFSRNSIFPGRRESLTSKESNFKKDYQNIKNDYKKAGNDMKTVFLKSNIYSETKTN